MLIDFDKVLERIGGFQRYQIYHYLLLGIASIPVGMHVLANVFHAGVPDHWCSVDKLDHLPRDQQQLLSGSCQVYDLDYTNTSLITGSAIAIPDNTTATKPCDTWHYAHSIFGWTITEKWDLVCADSWKRAMAQSILMFGFLVGTIGFGTLSDRIGRKISWYVGLMLTIVVGTTSAFVPEYWSHVILRMVSVAAASGYYTVAFVLMMETIGPDVRVKTGVMYQGYFAFGYMGLSALAYFIRNFVHLQLTISLIPALFLTYYCFIGESPRWLVTQGRLTQAKAELRRAARMNKRDYADDILDKEVDYLKKENSLLDHRRFVEPTVIDTTYSAIDLLRTPNLRKISANVFFNWFVNSFVYYGLSQGISALSGSVYWNLFISGVMEICALVISMFAIERVGRRWPLCLFLVTGGCACLACVPIPREYDMLRTMLAMVGRFSISGSFAIIYVFSAELFPTVLRNTGVGAGSMHARIGGLLAPFVAELGYLGWKPLPMVVFGALAVIAGIMTLGLPETLHKHLPETVMDGENFAKQAAFPRCRSKRKREPCKAVNGYQNGHGTKV